jgi:hypothetical protein
MTDCRICPALRFLIKRNSKRSARQTPPEIALHAAPCHVSQQNRENLIFLQFQVAHPPPVLFRSRKWEILQYSSFL